MRRPPPSRLLVLLVLVAAAVAATAAGIAVRAHFQPAPAVLPYDPLPRW